MTRLNEEHLKHKGPTDVIAFNYRPGAERAAGGEPLHGDIFLCLEVARRQARAFRATWQEEMVRYLIHGLLHLQGFDDLDAVSRREMKAIEDRLTRRARGCFRLSRLSPPTRLAT
jgi:probable rRNA maturation factor